MVHFPSFKSSSSLHVRTFIPLTHINVTISAPKPLLYLLHFNLPLMRHLKINTSTFSTNYFSDLIERNSTMISWIPCDCMSRNGMLLMNIMSAIRTTNLRMHMKSCRNAIALVTALLGRLLTVPPRGPPGPVQKLCKHCIPQ